jgi:hypothetical protein
MTFSYAVPRECASAEDDARLIHADLPGLDLDGLEHEVARVLVALAICDRHARERDWLLGRLRAVRTALRGRR